MTLAEITLPVDLQWARLHALVLSAELANRVLEVQDELGDNRYRLEPIALANGTYWIGADLLTECLPGGFLHAAFSLLDTARFDEIEVFSMADALALLPESPSPVS
jgi:hypothetical protein